MGKEARREGDESGSTRIQLDAVWELKANCLIALRPEVFIGA